MDIQRHGWRKWRGMAVLLVLMSLLAGSASSQSTDSPGERDYERGQQALDDGDYRDAARLFNAVWERHPDSSFASSAMYWEAFALYRQGRTRNLADALDVLDLQQREYPDHPSRDRDELRVRIEGELARRGDADAYRSVTERSEDESVANMEVRIAALNALLNMEADRAVPILKKTLAKREPEYDELREKAVFLISQKQTDETEEILLDVVRNDPSREVREQAVFWLHQVDGPKATAVLQEILLEGDDVGLQRKALFALSQQDSGRSSDVLKRVIEDPSMDSELRAEAIFWLGQSGGRSEMAYLQELYGQLDDRDLLALLFCGVSPGGGRGATEWLLGIAMDENESTDMRTQALFWAGQSGRVDVADLMGIFRSTDDLDMKGQVIFVLSQDSRGQALEALLEIATEEDDIDLKTNAIFWLGQSGDPRALEYLERIIDEG